MPFTKEQAKEKIQELVEKYRHLVETCGAKKLTEEETKKDFILPLFRFLNWNIEDSNEVSAEETISKKRVDYGFRIDGIPKFFLEAKALKEKLDIEHIEQAINYSWLKDTTWAILTNFAELKIFNAQWKSRGIAEKRFIELTFDRYIEEFDDLWLLSKDSFLNDELDKKAEHYGKKRKKTPVTPVMKQIFNDLMSWREKLTKDILRRKENKEIYKNEELLDECIQRILDRLIFIRVCEDREMEPPTLKSRLNEWKFNKKGKTFMQVLKKIFREFDQYYDGTIFNEHISEELVVSDVAISDIIYGLYQSSDRLFVYDFSAIDADVLGNIYEEYLGFVLKKGKKKPTMNHIKRKEMGIYYTPTFVVDFIVKNTVGEVLKSIKKEDVKNLKILDPACGSGSFLIKAFDYLLAYYEKNKENNLTDFLVKKGILQNNIFGVDLDPKAAEISQLNLLLRAVEKRKRLPMLQNNIKVGNSLIEDSKIVGDKAFNWDKEFVEIMKKGGFDIVIGNPPYVRQEELTPPMKMAFKKYEVFNASADLYTYFFERGLKLLKEGGLFAFIVSSKFTKTRYGKELRKFILNNSRIRIFIDFGDLPVFKEATTYPCIIILEKSSDVNKNKQNRILVSKITSLEFDNLNSVVKSNSFELKQKYLTESVWSMERSDLISLMKKIKESRSSLKKFIGDKLYRGVTTGCNEAFIIDERAKNELVKKDPKSKEILRRFLTGKDIKRYSTNFKNRYLIFSYTGIDINKYPAIKEHLSKFKNKLDKVWEVKHGKHPWYELRGCSYYNKFKSPKIIYPRINIEPNFTTDDEGYFIQDSSFLIPSSSKFLLGILNSKLMEFYAKKTCSLLRGGYYDYRYQYVELFPIAKPTKSIENTIVKLVNELLDLNKKLKQVGKLSDKGKKIQEQVKRINNEIDQKIYKLYGLTKEEIEIIEESVK